jgi:hypothetical protein
MNAPSPIAGPPPRLSEEDPRADAIGVPAGIRRGTGFIPEVESLRGIPILLVTLHHACAIFMPKPAAGGV